MNLSLKQQAMLQVVKVLSIGLLAGIATTLVLNYFSIQTVLTGLAIMFTCYMVYLFYGITLAQLEHRESLKKYKETLDK